MQENMRITWIVYCCTKLVWADNCLQLVCAQSHQFIARRSQMVNLKYKVSVGFSIVKASCSLRYFFTTVWLEFKWREKLEQSESWNGNLEWTGEKLESEVEGT